MLNYFPKYFTTKAIYLYIGTLVVVSLLFISHAMTWYWYVFGIVEVLGFFYFSNSMTKAQTKCSSKVFVRNLFFIALALRVVWVIFSYFFYEHMTGQPFEFSVGDAMGYHEDGMWVAHLLKVGDLQPYLTYREGNYADVGYTMYLGALYSLFGPNVFLVRLLKALLSAFTCVLVYRFSVRNFGESVGRMAGIFCLLMPNLIYYCGLHLKETEMTFLIVAFVERTDFAMRAKKLTFSNLVLPVLLAGSLFFFRTVLGATALFAFFTALIFTPGRTLKGWKRLVLLAWILLAIGYFMGGRVANEVEEVWKERHSNQQMSMDHRANMEGGNKFAKYASGSIFAPMILVIPFPTMVETPGQENQRLINGGNYVKGMMAFFVMFALFLLIKEKKWREYSFLGSFLISYLLVIAMSKFAAVERFHMPMLPVFLAFAAYGVSRLTNKTKKYYLFYLGFMFVALIGWSWFKIAGRM